MKTFETTRRLIACGDKKSRYAWQIVLILCVGLLNVLMAYALGLITKDLTASGGQNLLVHFSLFAAAELLIALLNWFRSVRMTRLTEAAESNYRKITARALLQAEYGCVQKLETGDLISRVVSDCRFAASNSELLVNGIRHVTIPVMLIAVIFSVDWRMGLGFMIPLLPVLLYPPVTNGSLSEIPPYRKAFADMNGQAKDLMTNRTTIKAYRLEDKADDWVDEAVEDYRRKGVRGIGKIYTANISALGINVLPLFGCALIGAMLLLRGQFAADSFMMAIMMASVATGELLALPNVLVNYPSGVVAGERLFAIWDMDAESSGEETVPADGAAVEFRDVMFRYPEQDDTDPPVLDHFSLTIQPGETVALVGHSGCGKSTALKMITGLCSPQTGTVSVLGRPVKDWNLESLRAHLGIVQQKPFVFQGTIRDNIRLGDLCADDTAIADAAERARLTAWISEQPEGWDADVGENGAVLSGGLRQRVELARLFLKDAPIELLDEATSALDATHQMEIQAALHEGENGSKTRIIIAHRLSNITEADRIVFLHRGKIIEEGTHEELLKRHGFYYGLFTAQEKGDDDGVS